MRIVHISDIHWDLKTLEALLKTSEVESSDLIAVTGDLSGPATPEQRKVVENERQVRKDIENIWGEDFDFLYHGQTGQGMQFSEYKAEFIKKNPKDLNVVEYKKSHELVNAMGKRQYTDIRKLLDSVPQQKAIVHGNWDYMSFFDVFDDCEMHEKAKKISGVKFFGYGGAESFLNSFALSRPWYDEDKMHDLLLEESPQVILTHAPPRKMTDRGNISKNLLGSALLRSYIFESAVAGKAPLLVMSGHSHSYRFERLPTGTLVSNPGNLGSADPEPYGTFALIDLDAKGAKPIGTYVMINDKAFSMSTENISLWKKRRDSRFRNEYRCDDED